MEKKSPLFSKQPHSSLIPKETTPPPARYNRPAPAFSTSSKMVELPEGRTPKLPEKNVRGLKTKVVVHLDAGFPNQVSIRGSGGPLNWNRGIPMKNEGPDKWVWETQIPFEQCEFKILINDQRYEIGENHKLIFGTTYDYQPKFD